MKRKLLILKIAFLACIGFALPSASQAQVVASAASTAKTPLPTLAEGIVSSNQTVLLDLVTKAGLMPILSNAGAYTFFAPSEEGLEQLKTKTPDELKTILSQHIVLGMITTKDMHDGARLKTLGGGSLRILKKKSDILIDGVRITSADQPFSNGVWHQIKGALSAPVSTTF
ncbi:hypothetical protein TH61_06475 [Rufibacter sp. DG15C]|uniref:fasciclin domain-containing protein n=1 Tax=Rufibacter sp. DG15C TaxID=1379909 RepID=UPI00078B499C|nr:fasciclin domain-containing protein [Rufibacter sp. DG15C]AMM50906.1 hypothetical protein TH61_06475 [Rufibacter sp. DG15C]